MLLLFIKVENFKKYTEIIVGTHLQKTAYTTGHQNYCELMKQTTPNGSAIKSEVSVFNSCDPIEVKWVYCKQQADKRLELCRDLSMSVTNFSTSDTVFNVQTSFPETSKRENGLFDDAENKFRAYAEYFDKHLPKLKTNRLMVYTCTWRRVCGGWGDRLRGLYSTFLLSLIRNMTFGIKIRKPCLFEHFICPNLLDWRVPFNKFAEVSKVTLVDVKVPPFTREQILCMVPETDVVRVTLNQNYFDAFKSHALIRKKIPFLNTLPVSDIHRILYHGLFRYEASFEAEIKLFFETFVKGHHLISAHIRMGDDQERLNDTDLEKIWTFLLRYSNRDEHRIFIASDTQRIKDVARDLFASQYIGLSGKIIHTDRQISYKASSCEGLKMSLFDHAVLARSHTLILTASGFGKEAAYIRHTSNNLYCYFRHCGVVPCRREWLEFVYGQRNVTTH